MGFLLRNSALQEEDLLEVSVRGKKLRFSFCRYERGIPVFNALRRAEETRKNIKGSGVICVAGAGDMEGIITHAINMGYRIYILDMDGKFLYGRGLFPVIRIYDSHHLEKVLEGIL